MTDHMRLPPGNPDQVNTTALSDLDEHPTVGELVRALAAMRASFPRMDSIASSHRLPDGRLLTLRLGNENLLTLSTDDGWDMIVNPEQILNA